MSKASVRVVSGAGGKGPACFLVDTGAARLMLDLGYGPQPGLWPDVTGIGKVDALLLTHSHRDHAGGLRLAMEIGNPPVMATAPVLAALGRDLSELRLALQGEQSVHGIRVRTGRNGHAPGGVWLHLDIGDGLLYTGDYSVESPIYAYDAPPEAATVILDASYGVYDHTLDDCERHLLTVIDREPLLLPVPVGGRGPEIAYYLMHTRDTLPHLGADLRKAMMDLATGPARESLRPDTAQVLLRVAREAPGIDRPEGVILAGSADAAEGISAELVARWEHSREPAIVFTGYLTPGTPAERLTQSGRALYSRWNVHPRLRDNFALVTATGARTVVPAFGDARHLEMWQCAFAPAHVTWDGAIAL